jgi:hypothetical protein
MFMIWKYGHSFYFFDLVFYYFFLIFDLVFYRLSFSSFFFILILSLFFSCGFISNLP